MVNILSLQNQGTSHSIPIVDFRKPSVIYPYCFSELFDCLLSLKKEGIKEVDILFCPPLLPISLFRDLKVLLLQNGMKNRFIVPRDIGFALSGLTLIERRILLFEDQLLFPFIGSCDERMKQVLDVFFFKKTGLSFVTKDFQINAFGKQLLELNAISRMCEEALKDGCINQKGIEYFLPKNEREPIKAIEAANEFSLEIELIDNNFRQELGKKLQEVD